ncbi:hypothetical protein H9P43_008829 [Blastocladiella emersonii ATCC 22665]|nr:hypothetical protein H9P43_008829 [Blastocladiella emersonii ATCC 22665]
MFRAATFGLLCLALCCAVHRVSAKATIRIGVLLPFEDPDPYYRNSFAAAMDAHALGISDAQEMGYLRGADVLLDPIDTTGNGYNEDGVAVFAAYEAIKRNVSAIFGGGTSDASRQISIVTRSFNIPICSYTSSSSELSDKSEFPWFFRTISSASALANSTMVFMRKRDWRRFSIVAEDVSTLVDIAREKGVDVLVNSLIYSPTAQPDKMQGILNQLVATDTRILVVPHWSSNGVEIIEYLHRNGWFASAPPGQPRVVLYVTDPFPSLYEISPTTAYDVLAQAGNLRPDVFSFPPGSILTDFAARYKVQNGGQPYPYLSSDDFHLGYACGVAMAVGLHRLMAENFGSVDDIASRSQRLYARMNVTLFNVNAARFPKFPVLLDGNGDPVPRFDVLYGSRNNTNRTADSPVIAINEIVDVSPQDYTVPFPVLTYTFPGLPPGAYPPAGRPLTNLNPRPDSPGSIAVLAVSWLVLAGLIASLAVLVYHRDHVAVRRSSLPSLVFLHAGCALTLGLGTAYIGVPTVSVCALRLSLLLWNIAFVVAALLPRLGIIYAMVRFVNLETRLRRGLNRRTTLVTSASTSALSRPTTRTRTSTRFSVAHIFDAIPRLSRASHKSSASTVYALNSAGDLVPTSGSSLGFGSDAGVTSYWRKLGDLKSRAQEAAAMLDGQSTFRVFMAYFAVCMPLFSTYAGVTIYGLAMCDHYLVMTKVTETTEHTVCMCRNAAVSTNLQLLTACVHGFCVALCLWLAWASRAAPYNLEEPKRSLLALGNAFAALVIVAILLIGNLSGPLYLFQACLMAYAAASTTAFFVLPIHLQIFGRVRESSRPSEWDEALARLERDSTLAERTMSEVELRDTKSARRTSPANPLIKASAAIAGGSPTHGAPERLPPWHPDAAASAAGIPARANWTLERAPSRRRDDPHPAVAETPPPIPPPPAPMLAVPGDLAPAPPPPFRSLRRSRTMPNTASLLAAAADTDPQWAALTFPVLVRRAYPAFDHAAHALLGPRQKWDPCTLIWVHPPPDLAPYLPAKLALRPRDDAHHPACYAVGGPVAALTAVPWDTGRGRGRRGSLAPSVISDQRRAAGRAVRPPGIEDAPPPDAHVRGCVMSLRGARAAAAWIHVAFELPADCARVVDMFAAEAATRTAGLSLADEGAVPGQMMRGRRASGRRDAATGPRRESVLKRQLMSQF